MHATVYSRKIDAFGAAVRFSGKNKEQLEGLIKDYDRYFVQERYRSLNIIDNRYVQSAQRISALEPSTEVVASICNDEVKITRNMVVEIVSSKNMSVDVFKICLRLFRERENRINIAYSESNRG